MYPFSIGVLMDGFRTDTLTALDKAVAVGATGIQVYATRGEMSPENMNAEARREFLKRVKDHGLTISALCGDLRHGFNDPKLNPELIEKSKRIVDLAKDLETGCDHNAYRRCTERPESPALCNHAGCLRPACGVCRLHARHTSPWRPARRLQRR